MTETVRIREYQSQDKKGLIDCLEKLVDYLIPLDPLKRMRRLPEYGVSYGVKLIEKVKKQNGKIFIAETNGKVIGLVAGIIETQSQEDLLEYIPSQVGRVLELFVAENYRGRKIGKKLMGKIESYFQNSSCDVARVEVFLPNKDAHRFYRKISYNDRDIDMIKKFQT